MRFGCISGSLGLPGLAFSEPHGTSDCGSPSQYMILGTWARMMWKDEMARHTSNWASRRRPIRGPKNCGFDVENIGFEPKERSLLGQLDGPSGLNRPNQPHFRNSPLVQLC